MSMVDGEQFPVPVFGYSGDPRSGKGTITQHLVETHPGVRLEEGGIDFRLITHELLAEGQIDPSMSPPEIEAQVGQVGVAELVDIVEARDEIVRERGSRLFYRPLIDSLVAVVAPDPKVHEVVYGNFQKRVAAAVQAEGTRAILLDIRDAQPIVRDIPAARLIMRTYVACLPVEAAWRELTRRGVPYSHELDRQIFRDIEKRARRDAERPVSPIGFDEESIDYWASGILLHNTVEAVADRDFSGDMDAAFRTMFKRRYGGKDHIRYGAGQAAVATGYQIFFDTTSLPMDRMLQAASVMFEEAMAAYHLQEPERSELYRNLSSVYGAALARRRELQELFLEASRLCDAGQTDKLFKFCRKIITRA